MKKVVPAVFGGILGLLISYLFAPSLLGMRPTVYEYFIKFPEFKPTILICTIVGIVIGWAFGLLLNQLKSSKPGQADLSDGIKNTPRATLNLKNKWNVFTLIGGGLIFISLFLPFYTPKSSWGVGGTRILLSELVNNVQVINFTLENGTFDSHYIQWLVRAILGWVLLIGSIASIFLSFIKNKKTEVTSLITSICGFAYLFYYWYFNNKDQVTFFDNGLTWMQMAYTLNIAAYLLLCGTVLLLVSATRIGRH